MASFPTGPDSRYRRGFHFLLEYATTYQKANHFWLAFFLGRPMKNPKACYLAPVRVAGWAGLWRATQLDKRRLPFACPPEFQRRQAKAAQ